MNSNRAAGSMVPLSGQYPPRPPRSPNHRTALQPCLKPECRRCLSRGPAKLSRAVGPLFRTKPTSFWRHGTSVKGPDAGLSGHLDVIPLLPDRQTSSVVALASVTGHVDMPDLPLQIWPRCAHDTGLLQPAGNAKCKIFPPWRGDDLHCDRQRFKRHGDGHHRQPDKRNWLGVDADVRAKWHLDAIQDECLLPEIRGAAQGVAGARITSTSRNSAEHAVAIPAAKLLPILVHQGSGHHGRLQSAGRVSPGRSLLARFLRRLPKMTTHRLRPK